MSHLQLKEISRRYVKGAAPAVDRVSIDVANGEFLVLLGPSGCGKTTLLRCIAGLERPDAGRIRIGDTTVFDSGADVVFPTNKRDIGMVFQNYSLWPHMTIQQNVAYPLASRRISRADQGTRVRKALEVVECEALADRLPSALSGGQQQRIALARALVAEPRLMLFDEPLSNLDYRLRSQLREEIRSIHRELRFTAVYVTHDQTEALQLGSRVAVMKNGRVEQIDTPEAVFSQPGTVYVADFLGITNRVEVSLVSGIWSLNDDRQAITHEPGRMSDGTYSLFARPSDIELVAPDSQTPQGRKVLRIQGGTVVDRLYGGERGEWIVEFGKVRLQASAPAHLWQYQPGDRVDIVVPSASVLHYGNDEKLVVPQG